MKTLNVVDMQNDFIDGTLGTPEAQKIVPSVIDKIQLRQEEGWEILYTRDTHEEDYLCTAEGKKLPVPHCIRGTAGWQIPAEIYREGSFVIDKPTFGWMGWNQYSFDRIELIGLCTDICVVSNALILKAAYPEIPVIVDAGCCAGVTVATHKAALETMKMCQVKVIGE
jgi:nicotinamidase-related amidase